MKKFKTYVVWGLSILLGVIIVALAVVALLPRTFTVQREVTIDQPVGEVFAYIRNMRNQPEFSTWSQLDPKMDKSFRGDDGEVGSVYAWSSSEENVGVGELEVTSIDEDRRIELQIRFAKPFVSSDPTVIEFEAIDPGQTKVKQTYFGKIPFPMNAFCSIASRTIGDGMDASFQNLKRLLEK